MTSIDGVAANIANAILTMSCRVGDCGKYRPANTSAARFYASASFSCMAERPGPPAHHLNSDNEADIHFPRHRGFIYSRFGWIFARSSDGTDLIKVADSLAIRN
jgi:hypothetical protein